ncbi:MAG: hypothetical protein H6661_10130 [Ardenticatenaceae bacterium]|nr:hypothetical protein [Ardenticatenaceae bacterium]
MTVGAPTPSEGTDRLWTAVRRDGKLLFEYSSDGLIRLRRWGRTFIVNMAEDAQPWLEDERLRQ